MALRKNMLRFSMKTMMAGVLLVAVTLVVLVWMEEQQQYAIKVVQEAGGTVIFDEDVNSMGYTFVYRDSVERRTLKRLLGKRFIDRVTAICLPESHMSPAVISSLRLFRHLRVLLLAGTDLDDRGLAQLGVLQYLQVLDVYDTRVTQSAVTQFRSDHLQCTIFQESPYF